MRLVVLLSLTSCVAVIGCARQPDTGNTAAVAPELSKSSPAAKEAQALARRYMTLIGAKDYAAARAMWGNGGADVGGSVEDFARTFEPYSQYHGQVGEPTDIKVTGSEQFVAVEAKANVVTKDTGAKKVIAGLIRFRRPVPGSEKNSTVGKWTIWAVDLRRPH